MVNSNINNHNIRSKGAQSRAIHFLYYPKYTFKAHIKTPSFRPLPSSLTTSIPMPLVHRSMLFRSHTTPLFLLNIFSQSTSRFLPSRNFTLHTLISVPPIKMPVLLKKGSMFLAALFENRVPDIWGVEKDYAQRWRRIGRAWFAKRWRTNLA